MESNELRIFRAVAQEGSITKAAQTLGYVQSNVTARIKQLEAELKTQLFYRQRGMLLTPTGEKLLIYAEKILHLLDEADIALNDSYDTYTVTTTATSKDALSNDEKSAALLIESTGFLVELFSGVPCTDLKVTVNYVNDSTKESIYSTSSDETPALKAFYS